MILKEAKQIQVNKKITSELSEQSLYTAKPGTADT